jgi:hypothetical protein
MQKFTYRSIIDTTTYYYDSYKGLQYLSTIIDYNDVITSNIYTVGFFGVVLDARILSEGTQGSGDMLPYKIMYPRLVDAKKIIQTLDIKERDNLIAKYSIDYIVEFNYPNKNSLNSFFGWGPLLTKKGLIIIFKNGIITIYKTGVNT